MPSPHLLAPKPIDHYYRDTGLRRALGPVALTDLGIGAINVSGIVVTTDEVTRKAGPGVVLAFVVAGRRVRPVPGVSRFTGGGE